MHIAVLGFGLIGGSIARAVHDRTDWSVAAWSPSGEGPARAEADGIVRAASAPEDAVRGADLVVLAAPPLVTLDLLDLLADRLRPALAADAVVTDVTSTKAAVVRRAEERALRFVGGHPMAGRETSGYGAADGELFVDRPWVVVPGADAPAVERVERLAAGCGARPVRLDAAAHDRAVAAISHLPLVLSAALAAAVTEGAGWTTARELAASGWRDMTRLARGDIAMGAGIAATNAAAIAEGLREVRAVIDGWLADLEAPAGPDPDAVAARLRTARDRLGEGP